MCGLRYPSEWQRSGITHDGASYELRPVLPSDVTRERAFIESIHEAPRYSRLLAVPHSGERTLSSPAAVDYKNRMAFIAVIHKEGTERIVSAARYAATDEPQACEFATAVGHEWQARGVVPVITQLLFEYARQQGFRQIFGTMRAANDRLIDLAHYLGLETRLLPGCAGVIQGWRSL